MDTFYWSENGKNTGYIFIKRNRGPLLGKTEQITWVLCEQTPTDVPLTTTDAFISHFKGPVQREALKSISASAPPEPTSEPHADAFNYEEAG